MSDTMSEIAVIEPTAAPVAGLALASMSPEQFVAETYAPFLATMAAHIAEAEAVTLDITTPAGMKEAIRWRAVFRDDYRLQIEAKRKAAKAPLLEAGKLIDSRAAELVEQVHPIEVHFHEQIKAEEKRKDDERAAAIEANRQRVALLTARLHAISAAPATVAGQSSGLILAERDRVAALEIGEDWQEFAERAAPAQREAVAQLEAMYSATLAAEEEAQRQREAQEAERQRLAAEQLALTIQREQQAEAAREMAQQKAELDAAREAIEAAKREAEAERQREADAQAAIAAANAAEVKRQLDELANARAALEAEKLAASEANQREHDHADALKENAERDAERLARDQEDAIDENALRKALALADAEVAFDLAVAAAEVDAAAVADNLIATTAAHLQLLQYDAEPTDEKIVRAYQEAFGGTAEQAIERLARFAAQYQQEAA